MSMKIILLNLLKWCNHNRLTLNLDKTFYIVFRSGNKKIPDFLNNITINNTNIQRVSSTKYLGVIVDEKLNWTEHIEYLTKALIKIGNSFKIIKHKVQEKNKHVLFNAYIASKVQYGIEVYGRATDTALQKVQVQQNRALKILFNKDYFTPTDMLHAELNKLKVKDTYKLFINKFIFKQHNNMLPNIFGDIFTLNNTIHHHDTRQSMKIHKVNPTNKIGQMKTAYQATLIWNSVPSNLRNLETLKSFNRKIKLNLLNQYSK